MSVQREPAPAYARSAKAFAIRAELETARGRCET